MKVFKPKDVFTFGKYKGEKIDFVYTFHPEYIEWLIINIDNFAIIINQFKHLHTCSIATQLGLEAKYFNTISVSVNGETKNCTLREYLTEFTNMYESHYLNPPEIKNLHIFSNEIILTNNKKLTFDNYSDQFENYTRPISYERWLKEEFGDDAETAYWNTH